MRCPPPSVQHLPPTRSLPEGWPGTLDSLPEDPDALYRAVATGYLNKLE